jgi:hypothetical protein
MLLVVLAATALLAGCSGGDDATALELLDGTTPTELGIELEGIEGDVVVTSHAVVSTSSLDPGSAAGTCLERFEELDVGISAVTRVAAATESVTFTEPARAIFGCDNSAGEREDDRRWCGGAYGELRAGRLSDPRLDILCRTAAGDSVGFVWVDPGEGTHYVAVEQPGYTEVYEVADDLPVRIATVNGVDVETSSAKFEYSEHDADGNRLREETLEAFVAG